jgi:hypothetical protein
MAATPQCCWIYAVSTDGEERRERELIHIGEIKCYKYDEEKRHLGFILLQSPHLWHKDINPEREFKFDFIASEKFAERLKVCRAKLGRDFTLADLAEIGSKEFDDVTGFTMAEEWTNAPSTEGEGRLKYQLYMGSDLVASIESNSWFVGETMGVRQRYLSRAFDVFRSSEDPRFKALASHEDDFIPKVSRAEKLAKKILDRTINNYEWNSR